MDRAQQEVIAVVASHVDSNGGADMLILDCTGGSS